MPFDQQKPKETERISIPENQIELVDLSKDPRKEEAAFSPKDMEISFSKALEDSDVKDEDEDREYYFV